MTILFKIVALFLYAFCAFTMFIDEREIRSSVPGAPIYKIASEKIPKLLELAPNLEEPLHASPSSPVLVPISKRGMFLLVKIYLEDKNPALILQQITTREGLRELQADARVLGNRDLFAKSNALGPLSLPTSNLSTRQVILSMLESKIGDELNIIDALMKERRAAAQKNKGDNRRNARRTRVHTFADDNDVSLKTAERIVKDNDELLASLLSELQHIRLAESAQAMGISAEEFLTLDKMVQEKFDFMRERLRFKIADSSRSHSVATAKYDSMGCLKALFHLLTPLISRAQIFVEAKIHRPIVEGKSKSRVKSFELDVNSISLDNLEEQYRRFTTDLEIDAEFNESHALFQKNVAVLKQKPHEDNFMALYRCGQAITQIENLLANLEHLAEHEDHAPPIVDDAEPEPASDNESSSSTESEKFEDEPKHQPSSFLVDLNVESNWKDRRLDALARLLNLKLWQMSYRGEALQKSRAVAVSAIVIDGKYTFVVATKDNTADAWVKKALQQIVAEADDLQAEGLLGQHASMFKKTLNAWWSKLSDGDSKLVKWKVAERVDDSRYFVDLAKLTYLLYGDGNGDRFDARMANALRNVDVKVIDNPHWMHAELALAEFFYKNRDRFVRDGNDGAYIGSHFKNCLACHQLIFGNKDPSRVVVGLSTEKFPIRTAGHFSTLYRSLHFPPTSLTLNRVNARAMQQRMELLAADHQNSGNDEGRHELSDSE